MSKRQERPLAAATAPAEWVDRHGDALFGYALLRVRDRETAEDLVQECFLAALDARQRFSGEASERTWLVSILKHKILDHFRRTPRQPETEVASDQEQTDRQAFSERGFWKHRFAQWGRDPQAIAEKTEFWDVVRRCLGRLPRRLADAFTSREMENCTSDEVCQVLGLTPTNLWARLHRARLGLRHCLDTHWFQGGKDDRARDDAEG